MASTIRRLVIGLLVLAVLTPIGLWLPELYKAGAAWGEWGSDELKEMVGYVPKGMQGLENLWTKTILAGYGVSGWTSPFLAALGYIISALLGIAVVGGLGFLLGRVLASKEDGSEEPKDSLQRNQRR